MPARAQGPPLTAPAVGASLRMIETYRRIKLLGGGVAEARPGDELPPFTRVTGLDNWNRYAAVNDEFVPIHMDDEAGREAGYPTAFGMGNLQLAYLHSLVRGWLGDDGVIVSLSC